MTNCCGNCGCGWSVADGKIGCGAAVDADALKRMSVGKNPVWAWRKYGPRVVLALAAGIVPDMTGTDSENMDPTDGVKCAAWKT